MPTNGFSHALAVNCYAETFALTSMIFAATLPRQPPRNARIRSISPKWRLTGGSLARQNCKKGYTLSLAIAIQLVIRREVDC